MAMLLFWYMTCKVQCIMARQQAGEGGLRGATEGAALYISAFAVSFGCFKE